MLKTKIEETYNGLMKKIEEKLYNQYFFRKVSSSLCANDREKHIQKAMVEKIMEDYSPLFDILDENNQKLMSMRTLNLSNLLPKNAKPEDIDKFNAEILDRVGDGYEIVVLSLTDIKKAGKDAPKVTILKNKAIDFTDFVVETGKHTEYRAGKQVVVEDIYYNLADLSLNMAKNDMYYLPMPKHRKDICQYYDNMVFSYDIFDLVDTEDKRPVEKILLGFCKEKMFESFSKSFEKSNLIVKMWQGALVDKIEETKENEEDSISKLEIEDYEAISNVNNI